MNRITILTLMAFAGADFFVLADEPPVASRAAWTMSRVHGTAEPPPPYQVTPAFPQLTFQQPLDLTAPEGSDRLYVLEQQGRILSFPLRPDADTADEVLNLKSLHEEVSAAYSLTFHPNFAQNRLFYVCYIEGGNREDGTCVSEFRMRETNPPTADPGSERQLIRWWSGGHNGCSLQFGPDGMLYISTGDGGAPSPPDPLQAGQDCSNLLSCILRIDVRGADDGTPYQIPADNPFLHRADVRPEIWAFGFRNPWRMSFDRRTGDLWVGDVGWQLWEMIHRVERGGNYGWPIMEGPQTAVPGIPQGPAPISPPVVWHPHSEAASMTGGFVYRGNRIPELQGVYVYGDYQTGRVWGLRYEDGQVTWHEELAQTPLQLVSFGEDSAGELYLLDYQRSQQIWQLSPQPQQVESRQFPELLSGTGIFRDVSRQLPETGVLEYSIAIEQWQDGATSQRWLALPGTEPLLHEGGRWIYPDDAVLVKTLSMQLNMDDPASRHHLETQLLHRHNGVWRPYTYRWNEQQTDAELVSADGDTRQLEILDSDATDGRRMLEWRFAARSECQVCHNPWVELKTAGLGIQSASPLGLSAAQLQTETADRKKQTDVLRIAGWIKGLEPAAEAARLAAIGSSGASLDQQVRSWLHVNCSHCHQPHAGGSALIDVRRETAADQMQLLEQLPLRGGFGISGARLISPGDPEGSVLLYRIASCAGGRMPRMGATLPDRPAIAAVQEWIKQMPVVQSAETDAYRNEVQEVHSALRRVTALKGEARETLLLELIGTTRGTLAALLKLQGTASGRSLAEEIAQLSARSTQLAARDLFASYLPADQFRGTSGRGMDLQALLALAGNAGRGREVFRREGSVSCVNCHQAEGQGIALGPPLDGIGRRMRREEILSQIHEPSRRIEPAYLMWSVETTQGLVHTGLLRQRTAENLQLLLVGNRLLDIPADEVESLTVQQKSLMPEQLLRDLTIQESADLLEYLVSLVATVPENPENSR